MRTSLLRNALSIGAVLISSFSFAQQADRFAYSMTDVQNQNGNWVYLRIVDLSKGEFSGSLLNGSAGQQIVYDAVTKKQITDAGTTPQGFSMQPAFSSGVAALAFDSKHNRVYFTPMFVDQLRYYDLKTQQVYYVTTPLTNKPVKSSDQGNIVTRMTFAPDGYGYAMTNDGMQLIRFSTGKRPEIVDLGELVDDPANKGTSIHNSCSSFGGDMVADDDGNLYVLSARNHVFKVNIESRVATHIGTITGLPANFTVNGAAVNENNQIVVGSAVESTSLYVVDTKNWTATAMTMSGTVMHTSDLANGNILVSGNKPKTNNVDVVAKNTPTNTGDGTINIFPNPVTNNQFTVQFSELAAGAYTVQVTDVTGRQVMQQIVNISSDSQTQVFRLGSSSARGVYMVKVTDPNSKSVFSTKIVVQ